VKVAIETYTPGQVHFFKHFIWQMKKRGHDVLLNALRKDVSLRLLDDLHIEYNHLGSYGDTLPQKILNVPRMGYRWYREAKRFDPDAILGFGTVGGSHASRLLKKPCIQFTDTESAREQRMLFAPFSDVIITPSCFREDLGSKQILISGYKELAYLHPNRFVPDPAVLRDAGVRMGEPFFVVRFVSWTATHDIGQRGIRNKIALVEALRDRGSVLITSEGPLPKPLEELRISIEPGNLHDLLHYATLYVGEGATTAVEAAVLGTPAIYISSIAEKLGNMQELEKDYGLLYHYPTADAAYQQVQELLQRDDLKAEWSKKRERLLQDKIDVTAFMVWFVEQYPDSRDEMRADPGIQHTFH
jgi:uncharacterized protein